MTKFLRNDTIWRAICAVLMTAILGIGSWGLLEVTAAPKIYRTKVEALAQREELLKSICDFKAELNAKIKEIKYEIIEHQTELKKDMKDNQDKLERKIDSINTLMLRQLNQNNKDKK